MLQSKREEFRKYLDETGVIESLQKSLIRLYQKQDKPDNAVNFVRENMCETCPTDEEYYKLKLLLEEANVEIKSLKKELTFIKDNLKRSPSEINMLLERGFVDLESDEECQSLLKKHLTKEIFDELKELKTSYGSTLLDCIQSGLENHDSNCGVYAADPDAYAVFAPLFDPIIDDYHNGFPPDAVHPASDWGDSLSLGNLDPGNEYIISTRIRCARSIAEFPFNPRMTVENYTEIMEKAKEMFCGLEGELKGTFYPLEGMEPDVQQQLIDDHFLFKEGDRFLQAGAACRFWPIGRGIYFNEDKTYLMWVNEEDHFRCISMQPGGDIGQVYHRLVTAVAVLEENMEFTKHPRLGILTFCPTNLGTSIRASVHIKLPKLASDPTKLDEVADKFHLQVRGTRGEHTEAEDGIYDVSNKRRIGLTEFEAVKEMADGITEMIKIEKEL